MLNNPKTDPDWDTDFRAAVDRRDVDAVKDLIGWDIGCACVGAAPGETLCPCRKMMEYVSKFISVDALKQNRVEPPSA